MHEDVERALAEARALGFLGPGPLEQHEASARAFREALGPLTSGSRVLDLGSGGGVPGLLLAAVFEQVGWLLLDVNRRRTSFLARTVGALGWGNHVEVLRAPAEVAGHEDCFRAAFDAVVSRSFAPPAVTAECAVPFLRLGGRLLVAEPPRPDPSRWPTDGLAALGLVRMASATDAVATFVLSALPPSDVARPWKTMERDPRW